MIPGSNLLNVALRIVAPQTPLQWRAWVSSTPNGAGYFEQVYSDPVDIVGSMQPINRNLYQQYGLDMSKDYSTLYTSSDVKVADEDRGGDVIIYDGETWICESGTDWRHADGWRKILCCKVRVL